MDTIDVSEQTTNETVAEAPIPAAAPPPAPTPEPEVSVATGAGGEVDSVSLMEQYLNDPSHDYKHPEIWRCHGRRDHASRPRRDPGRHRLASPKGLCPPRSSPA